MIYPEFIYDIGNGKYARGRAGERAAAVVQQKSTYDGTVPVGVGFRGVRGRRPVIPVAAIKLNRRAAGAALCRAFGLERW